MNIWSTEEDKKLLVMVEQGLTTEEIAKAMGRSYKSIQHRRADLTRGTPKMKEEKSKKQDISVLINQYLKDTLSKVTPYKSAIQSKADVKGDTLVIQLSDFHAGKIVTDQEGETIYDENIFRSRINVLCEQILKLLDNNISKGVPIKEVVILSTGDQANGENIYATQAYEQELAPPKQVMLVIDVITKLIVSLLKRNLPVTFYGVRGNHGRCFDLQTELLTPYGWKKREELSIGDEVATVNPITLRNEFNPIQHIVDYHKKETMVEFDEKLFNAKVTQDHDLVYYNKITGLTKLPANHVPKHLSMLSTGNSIEEIVVASNPAMLKVIGWILTDGCYCRRNSGSHTAITIYQAEQKVGLIEQDLKDAGLIYSKSLKNNTPEYINGKLLKRVQKQYALRILVGGKKEELLKLLPEAHEIQEWMYYLAKNEMNNLLSTILLGDGTDNNCIYGREEFLNDLQGVLVMHGIPCSLNEDKRGNYYLWLRKSSRLSLFLSKPKIKEQVEPVYCVTVKNSTLITRRNGKTLVMGNTGKDTDVTSNWDLQIYLILDFWARLVLKNPKLIIKFAETEHMVLNIRGHNYLIRHIAPEQCDSPAGRAKVNEWARRHKAEAIVYGHWHHFGLNDVDGIRVIRGASIVGGDSLSESMAKHSAPMQLLWGVNEQRVTSFFYAVDLGGQK
jgi:hypothetical protein